jgi:hypothetical protein
MHIQLVFSKSYQKLIGFPTNFVTSQHSLNTMRLNLRWGQTDLLGSRFGSIMFHQQGCRCHNAWLHCFSFNLCEEYNVRKSGNRVNQVIRGGAFFLSRVKPKFKS